MMDRMSQELGVNRQIGFFSRAKRGVLALCMLSIAVVASGCTGTKGFFDPSKTGYFHRTPITMPILDRIDAIEPAANPWGETAQVTPEDLLPNDLTYRLHPGDQIDIQIYELYETERFHPIMRRVDQGGYVTIPEIGQLVAAGLTVDEFQQELVHALRVRVMGRPTVTVNLIEGAAFNYIIYGHVPSPGRYTLSDPTLRLLEALTMAGGLPLTTRTVYVVRQVSTVDEHTFKPGTKPQSTRHTTTSAPSLEDLINQLDDGSQSRPASPSPGAFSVQSAPPVSIDDVHTPTVTAPSVDVAGDATTSWVYIPERDAWVEVAPKQVQKVIPDEKEPTKVAALETSDALADTASTPDDLILERVIEVDYQRLSRGENDLNLIVRPGDQIYVDGPPTGYYYIEGEIVRPGVYDLPTSSERITLSRAVAGAGGLGALAVPDRVDLIRLVGNGREATIRLDLSAIRSRTEPDVYLKPGDHIIVGTDFWAYPLAVFRNGLRMNYGFGFLLDRNFGNDVFGPPPVNVVGG
jgi:polysaccharide export outer membrane protein